MAFPKSHKTPAGFLTSQRTIALPRHKRLNLVPLVAVIFFTVSGGPYGLEPLVGTVGAGWAVVLVVLTPIVWSLPIALMAAELSSMLPEEGGYYVWVKEGLGEFWGVQEGWLTICYTSVDLAIYPVLFVNYLAYFLPSLQIDDSGQISPGTFFIRWLIMLSLIVLALALNWRGARSVGVNALVSTVVVLMPFVLFVFIGMRTSGATTSIRVMMTDLAGNKAPMLALGFSIVLWNYCGWDNVSTYAGEVNEPSRNYPRALMLALLLSITVYLLPLLTGIAISTDPGIWSENAGWPELSQLVGGPWLAFLVAAVALVSGWSLLNSQVLYVSRLPYVMAVEGWLPSWLAHVAPKTGVPVVALMACGLVSALFALLTFGELVILEILIYGGALLLQYLALLVLRWKKADMPRPFRVPGKQLGLVLVTLAPMFCVVAVVGASVREESNAMQQVLVTLLLIGCGPLLYLFGRHRHRRSAKNDLSVLP